jgi:hypothetical protein
MQNVHVVKSLQQLSIVKSKLPFVSTIIDGIQFFGLPKYFFRLHFTSAVNHVPCCEVQWVSTFLIARKSRNCCIGSIKMDEWEAWRSSIVNSSKVFPSKFISFNDLLASRFCLSFIPPKNASVRDVEVAFMAIDSEKVGEDVNDSQHFNFGDNQFPNFLGSKNGAEGNDNVDSLDIEFDTVKNFIPSSILHYITSNV